MQTLDARGNSRIVGYSAVSGKLCTTFPRKSLGDEAGAKLRRTYAVGVKYIFRHHIAFGQHEEDQQAVWGLL